MQTMDETLNPTVSPGDGRPWTQPLVLVIDPDSLSRRLEVAVLRADGYRVETARSSKAARALLRRHAIDAVVIDPVFDDAAEVVRDFRLLTEGPIIVVNESDVEAEKVELLDAGADDYLTKPFGIEELLARLRAVFRRSIVHGDDPPVVTPHFVVHLSDRRCCLADGTEVSLTPTEWRLLEFLARHPGRLLTQSEVLESLRGIAGASNAGYLRVYMGSIRHKLEPDPAHPRYFLTVPGVGVRFMPGG